MSLIENLNWRYATKKMNGQTVPQDKVDTILEAIRLAATSYGLQPFKVIVVTDKEVRGLIHEKACPQPQIVEGSHVLVFAPYAQVGAQHVENYIDRIARERKADKESLQPFKEAIMGTVNGRTQEQLHQWAARQAYIALGHGLVAAATERVDATPMEGFNPAALDEVLGLADHNLKSVAILTLGYRDAEKDYLSNAQKVRKPAEELFIKR
jgi:nitroreductase